MLGRKSSLGWTIGVAALSLIARCGAATADGTVPPPAVSVTPVASRQVTETGDFLGRVTAINKVDIVARVAGFIEERNFTEGQKVKTGDLLFRLEQATYKAAVRAAARQSRQGKGDGGQHRAPTAARQGARRAIRTSRNPRSTSARPTRRRAGRGHAGAGAARPGANQSRLHRDPFTHRWTDRTSPSSPSAIWSIPRPGPWRRSSARTPST